MIFTIRVNFPVLCRFSEIVWLFFIYSFPCHVKWNFSRFKSPNNQWDTTKHRDEMLTWFHSVAYIMIFGYVTRNLEKWDKIKTTISSCLFNNSSKRTFYRKWRLEKQLISSFEIIVWFDRNNEIPANPCIRCALLQLSRISFLQSHHKSSQLQRKKSEWNKESDKRCHRIWKSRFLTFDKIQFFLWKNTQKITKK